MWQIWLGNGPWNRRCSRLAVSTLVACFLVGAGSLGVVAQEYVVPPRASWIAPSEQTPPTSAARQFCRRFPLECQVDASEPEFIQLTEATWRAITAVNQHVNGSIIAVTDQEHWGVVDRWDYPDDGKGDCEDIQLLKRKLLIEKGVPHRAMRMAMVMDEEGAGHAVLMIRSDRGDFILDNQRNQVLGWELTGYTFLKREGSAGSTWVSLSGHQGQIVVAKQ